MGNKSDSDPDFNPTDTMLEEHSDSESEEEDSGSESEEEHSGSESEEEMEALDSSNSLIIFAQKIYRDNRMLWEENKELQSEQFNYVLMKIQRNTLFYMYIIQTGVMFYMFN